MKVIRVRRRELRFGLASFPNHQLSHATFSVARISGIARIRYFRGYLPDPRQFMSKVRASLKNMSLARECAPAVRILE